MQFSAVKEAARQISELNEEDYLALDCCYTLTQTPDFSLDILEPIAIQLSALVDQLKTEKQGGGAWTSDSGALSDYESSLCETDGLKSGSNSLITLCGEETELSKELEVRWDADESTAEEGPKGSVTDTETVMLPSPSAEVSANESIPDDGHSSMGTTETVTPLSGGASTSKSSVETPRSAQGGRHTSEDKERDINDLLSKIKSMSPEDLPKTEMLHRQSPEEVQSSNSDVILVSDLEKELFSDSSEDISPEKAMKETASSQQEGRPKKFGSRNSQYYERNDTERVPSQGTPKWQRDGDPSSRYYNKRGSYRQKSTGSFKRGGYRAKENDDTENEVSQNAREGETETWASHKLDNNRIHREKFSDEDHCNRASSDYSTRKGRGGLSHPSPLVHSQNMWSSTRRGGYRQRRDYKKASSTFNHYEVGCFLMQGIV